MSSGTSTACCRSASIGTISSARSLVAASTTPAAAPGLVGLQPADGDDAPPVAGLQAREAVLGPRRGQVVAEVLLHLQEVGRDDGADGVRAQVLGAGAAVPVPVEAGQRLGAARLQWAAQHVALLVGSGVTGAPHRRGRRPVRMASRECVRPRQCGSERGLAHLPDDDGVRRAPHPPRCT